MTSDPGDTLKVFSWNRRHRMGPEVQVYYLFFFQVKENNTYFCVFSNSVLHRGATLTLNVTSAGTAFQDVLNFTNPGDGASAGTPVFLQGPAGTPRCSCWGRGCSSRGYGLMSSRQGRFQCCELLLLYLRRPLHELQLDSGPGCPCRRPVPPLRMGFHVSRPPLSG